LSHFEPPKFNIALTTHVYDNAVAFGPRGHVTLLRTKFQPFNCPPIGLTAPSASRWALNHISSISSERVYATSC